MGGARRFCAINKGGSYEVAQVGNLGDHYLCRLDVVQKTMNQELLNKLAIFALGLMIGYTIVSVELAREKPCNCKEPEKAEE